MPPQPQSPCTCAQANAFLRSYASSNTDGCTVTTQNCGSADFSTWSCSYKSDRSPQYEWTCTDAKALNAGASNVETGSDSSSMGPIIGGAGEQTAPPCNLARALARRPHGLHPAPPPAPPRHTVGGVAVVGALVGAGVYAKMRARNPPGGGQAQGGVTLSAPAQSAGENRI